MTMHHIELSHNIFMFKVVLLKYSTYMFSFHTFIFVLANAYPYKSYDHFLINTKEYTNIYEIWTNTLSVRIVI